MQDSSHRSATGLLAAMSTNPSSDTQELKACDGEPSALKTTSRAVQDVQSEVMVQNAWCTVCNRRLQLQPNTTSQNQEAADCAHVQRRANTAENCLSQYSVAAQSRQILYNAEC